MKTITCDICGLQIKEGCDSVENKIHWVKLVTRIVGKHYDNFSFDLCKRCYAIVITFIEQLKVFRGNVKCLISANSLYKFADFKTSCIANLDTYGIYEYDRVVDKDETIITQDEVEEKQSGGATTRPTAEDLRNTDV